MEENTEVPKSENTEQLVVQYIKLREAIYDLEEKHEAAVKVLKDEQDKISDQLVSVCNTLNADSIRTPAGTISRTVSTRYWVSDWENMYNFIREHDAVHLLERRVHSTHMKQFLEENPDLLPIGLQVDSRYTVRVRKASNK
jgi:hypothetical protein